MRVVGLAGLLALWPIAAHANIKCELRLFEQCVSELFPLPSQRGCKVRHSPDDEGWLLLDFDAGTILDSKFVEQSKSFPENALPKKMTCRDNRDGDWGVTHCMWGNSTKTQRSFVFWWDAGLHLRDVATNYGSGNQGFGFVNVRSYRCSPSDLGK